MTSHRILILIAFGFSGAAALIYEVVWTRELSLLIGSTTYALSTILSTFMAGLALGAFFGGKLADRAKNLLLLFGLIELGIAFFGFITIPLINLLPPLYFKIYKTFHLSPSLYFFFQFFLCAGIMLIPATLMGATFPIVSRKVTDSIDTMGRGVGSAYSWNTFGGILGSFSAGFILIPVLGVYTAAIIAAVLNSIVAVMMILISRAGRMKTLISLLIILAMIPVAVLVASRQTTSYINYYTASRYQNVDDIRRAVSVRDVLFEKDYREGRVRLWRSENDRLIVQVAGKIEGSDESDIDRTLLLAYLPIASHRDPRSFLTIGLGTGITLAAAKEHLPDVSVAEINRGVVDALTEFGPRDLFDNVDVNVNDARNYLLLTERRFDIISSGPSYPTESSSGNLFTLEFYRLAESRLKPAGVMSQNIPYYLFSNDDVTSLIRTFGSVFAYVHLWNVPRARDLILVGSNTPFMFKVEEIQERVGSLNTGRANIVYSISKSPEQVREIVQSREDIPLNTDDKPLLEFHAARNLLTGIPR